MMVTKIRIIKQNMADSFALWITFVFKETIWVVEEVFGHSPTSVKLALAFVRIFHFLARVSLARWIWRAEGYQYAEFFVNLPISYLLRSEKHFRKWMCTSKMFAVGDFDIVTRLKENYRQFAPLVE